MRIAMEEAADLAGRVAPGLAIEEARLGTLGALRAPRVSQRRLLAPWPHPGPNQGAPRLIGQGDSGVPAAAEARHRGEAAQDGCLARQHWLKRFLPDSDQEAIAVKMPILPISRRRAPIIKALVAQLRERDVGAFSNPRSQRDLLRIAHIR